MLTYQNHIPFVYLVGWPDLNKFYIGVRYKDGCHPSDMWTKYFTSSKYVKAIAQEHGRPPVIDIIKTFDTKEEAIAFETSILSDNKVHILDNFLNAAAGGAQHFTPEVRKKMSDKAKGRKSWNSGVKTGSESDEVRMKKSEAHKGKPAHNKGKKLGPRSGETRQRMSDARKGIVLPHMKLPKSEETKQNLSDSKKGIVLPHMFRKNSPETIAKRAASVREYHHKKREQAALEQSALDTDPS